MIKKTGGKYEVVSEHGGKNLGGGYTSKAAAVKRLGQVEYFKHRDAGARRSSRATRSR